MRDAGFDPGGAVTVNRFALGSPVQPFLQLGKVFGRFFLFSGLNQRQEFFLGVSGSLQKNAVYFATTKSGAGLFGGRSGIGHKRKQCLREAAGVNP